MRVDLGVSEDLPVQVQQDLAREVEEAGLGGLWTNEARGRDALLVCQAWAAATVALEIGTAVVPLWTRSPAILASAAATLQEASGGRLRLGLGVSHAATMQRWHGVAYRHPLAAARETLTVLRTLLAGERAEVDGQVISCHGFRLEMTPLPPPPPLYLAALGPRMLGVAGAHADGVLLNWSGTEEVTRAAVAVRGAAGDAGRAAGQVEVAGYVRIAVDPDPDAARGALARALSGYCALPAYASHLERQGLGAAVEAARAAHRAGDPPARALGDDALSRLGWWGTPDHDPGPALAAYARAGLDRLVARVVTVGADPAASVRHALGALAGSPAVTDRVLQGG